MPRTTRSAAAWFALIFVVSATAGCERSGGAEPAPPTDDALRAATPLPGTGEPDERKLNADRIEAMLSIHAHYFELRDGVKPPEGVRVMPLEDAVAFLKKDRERGGPGADSRARRAIARLASVSVGVPLQLEVASRYSKAIETLGGDLEKVETTYRPLERPALPNFDAAGAASRAQYARFVALREMIAADIHTKLTQKCAWRSFGEPDVSGIGEPEARYSVDIIVPFSADRVKKALDPQAWDQCSKFFCPPPDRTCLATDGTPPICLPGIGGSSFPLSPGSPYEDKLVFEHFSSPILNVEIKNLLKVTAGPKQDEDKVYQVHYKLERYLGGAGNGLISDDLVLKKDVGRLWVKVRGANEAEVHANKTLRFDDPTITAAYLGGLMVAELGGELAEVACCAIQDPAPKTCP